MIGRLLLLSWLLLLQGCSQLAPQTTTPSTVTWQLQAKMAVNYDNQRFSATLRWENRPNSAQLILFDPLGRVVAQLSQDASSAYIQTKKGQNFHGTNITQLMQQQLGWSLPVDALQYWVQGQPAPQIAYAETHDDDPLRQRFIQGAWSIEAQRKSLEQRPHKLTLQGPQLKLKLVRMQWQPLI